MALNKIFNIRRVFIFPVNHYDTHTLHVVDGRTGMYIDVITDIQKENQ